ncbi:MAG: class I SAM-dependent methyltransferase [Candidatus Omnitrophota bacterium]
MDKIKKETYIEAETKKAWDENWKPYESEELMEIFTYPRVKKQLALYIKYISKEGKILEGGCGLGPYLIYLHNKGYDVVGVDYNEDPLKKIKSYNNSLPVSVMDVRNLLFKDKTFNAYLSLGVIEHFVEGPQKAISEAYRVLKNDGVFIVQVPIMNIFLAIKYPLELLKRNQFLRKLFRREEKNYYWQQYFKAGKLKQIIEKEGFRVFEIVPMDQEHSIISFSGIFRDKKSYDGANKAGLALSRFCERHFPWLSAANMVLICKKQG